MSYVRERKGKKGKTFEYTVSRMVNGVSKPIRKGGFRTKREAEIAAAEVEVQLAKGLAPTTVARKVLFEQYFEDWIEIYKKPTVSPTTLKHYEYSLNAVKEYFPGIVIKDIKRSEYQKFLNWFGANKAKETVDKVHRHIRSCVQGCFRRSNNPI
jgi:hypothetical protein